MPSKSGAGANEHARRFWRLPAFCVGRVYVPWRDRPCGHCVRFKRQHNNLPRAGLRAATSAGVCGADVLGIRDILSSKPERNAGPVESLSRTAPIARLM